MRILLLATLTAALTVPAWSAPDRQGNSDGRENPCGNRTLDSGETCDPPGSVVPENGAICHPTCTYCGDALLEPRVEQCELPQSRCTADCTWRPSEQLLGRRVQANHEWTRFSLQWFAPDAVILAGPPSRNDPERGAIRLRNVDGTSFEARFQEWSHLDGDHGVEEFGFLALPTGTFVLGDGSRWDAGTVEIETSGPLRHVALPPGFARPPAVFLTVQTSRDPSLNVLRLGAVTTSGFDVRLVAAETGGSRGNLERVGFLAVGSQFGSGSVHLNQVPERYRLERFATDHQWTPFVQSQIRLEQPFPLQDGDTAILSAVHALAVGSIVVAQEFGAADLAPAVLRREPLDFGAPLQWGLLRNVDENLSYAPNFSEGFGTAVVTKPFISQDPDPAVVSSSGTVIDGHGLRVRLLKWPYLGDRAITGDVFFLAKNRSGHLALGDVEVEADFHEISRGRFRQLTFRQPFRVAPAVFASCLAGSAAPRIRNVTTEGFEAILKPQESDPGDPTCFLYWIAIEPGHGTLPDGRTFDVFRTTATDEPVRILFPNAVSRRQATVVIDINSYNGADPVFPRLLEIGKSDARLILQEEQSLDAETTHLTEEVVVFVGD